MAEHDERLTVVVECHCFGGLSATETAEVLGVPRRTVDRGWTRVRT